MNQNASASESLTDVATAPDHDDSHAPAQPSAGHRAAAELAESARLDSFSQLQLAEPLARAVAELGYSSMTPIQAQAIPVVLQGRDVMGAAQTGTGKTAAFSLPLLQRMLKHENASTSPARHPVRALVLLPTRELADQVAKAVKAYAKYTNQIGRAHV